MKTIHQDGGYIDICKASGTELTTEMISEALNVSMERVLLDIACDPSVPFFNDVQLNVKFDLNDNDCLEFKIDVLSDKYIDLENNSYRTLPLPD